MASGESTSETEDHLSELRIVLIGRRRGKGRETNVLSKVGNFILGKDVFDVKKRTVHTVVKQEEVFGTKVTVVNTPDWTWDSPLGSTPLTDQLEIKRSVHLCPPGPHAFLVVTQTDDLEETENTLHLEDHVEFLFGDRFWMHSLLLVVQDDIPVLPKFDKTLRWFIEKCEFRMTVLDLNNRSDDGSQVRQLFEVIRGMVSINGGGHYSTDRGTPIITLFHKIDAVVATNHSCHYKVDSDMLPKLHEREKKVEEEIQTTFPEKKQQTSLSDEKDLSRRVKTALRIMLLGKSKAEKTTVAAAILKQDTTRSCMAQLYEDLEVQNNTKRCWKRQGRFSLINLSLDLVDVPGWFSKTPMDQFKEDILDGLNLSSPGPHAFLLVVSLTEKFSEDDKEAVEEHMKLLGRNVWKHTIVVFAGGFWLGEKTFQEYVRGQGEPLKWLLERCGNRYHVLDCLDWDDVSRVAEMTGKLEIMTLKGRSLLAVGEKRKPWTLFQKGKGKEIFTMEQWMKREEEWLRREEEWKRKEADWKRREEMMMEQMQKAGLVSPLPVMRQGSMQILVPSMSGDAISDAGSYRTFPKVSDWLKRCSTLSSSGYNSTARITEADMWSEADISETDEHAANFV